jgi:dTMP kinase
MLSPEERLEQLEKVLDEMRRLSERTPIIVEGKRDVDALRRLGIVRNVSAMNKGESVIVFCENLARKFREAAIMTDWDRRGGQLGRKLKTALEANGVKVNADLRTQIVILSKKEIKDIEGLPAFIDRLRTNSSGRIR